MKIYNTMTRQKEEFVPITPGEVKPSLVQTYEDHRMALAFAPLAFRVPGIRINNPQVVTKSYPHYWEDLAKVEFEITED